MEWVNVVSLKRHVFARIPKEHLIIPSGANTSIILLPYEDVSVRILGFEKDISTTRSSTPNRVRKEYKGTLLFCYEGYKGKEERTFIASYDLSSKQYKFFISIPVCTIVGASLFHPFLIFTKVDSNQLTQSFLLKYDLSKPKEKPIFPSTYCFEKIHFIAPRYFVQLRESTIKEPNTFPNARIFEITADQQVSLIKSFGNPGKYIWIDWDIHIKALYLIEKNSEKISTLLNDLLLVPLTSKGTPQETRKLTKRKECTFSVIRPRADEIEEFAVELDLSEAISSKKMGTSHDNRILPVFSRFFSVVRLGQNQFCLCHQHPFIPGDEYIRVSLYWLNREDDMTVLIPTTHLHPTKVGSVRVFFTSVHGLVAIIIPGLFLQLVDGRTHREIYPSILLSDKSDFRDIKPKIHVDVMTRLHCEISEGDSSYLLIDGSSGNIYDVQIGRPWIVHQFYSVFMRETPQEAWQSSEKLIHAIHLAMFHVADRDDELFIQILSMIFLGPRQYSTDSIDKDILKEILICFVYNEARKIRSYEALLAIIPVSSICPLHEWNHPLVTVEKSDRVNTTEHATIPRLPTKLQQTTTQQSGKAEKTSFSSHIPSSARVMHTAVSKHLEQYLMYDKKQSHKLATAYCFLLMNTVEVLFRDYIMKGRNENETTGQFFQLLLSYYSALEDLSFPIVGSFNHEFLQVAFKSLPRRLFSQYVEQGIFTLDRAFVDFVIPQLNNEDPVDISLKSIIFTSIEFNSVADILEDQDEYLPYIFDRLIEHHASETPVQQKLPLSRSEFLPRTIATNHLQNNTFDPIIPDFIERHQDKVLTNIHPRRSDYVSNE